MSGLRQNNPMRAAEPLGSASGSLRQVAVTGATGLIGAHLCRTLAERGLDVIVLTRDLDKARAELPNMARYVSWRPPSEQGLREALEGVDALVNLAGAPLIGKRWDEAYKKVIYDSRVLGTRALVNALADVSQRPYVMISASAVGYYGPRDDTPLDELAPPGDDFLAKVCLAWEQEAIRAERFGVRVVPLRSGVILDDREGALPQMLTPFRFMAGGPIGSGKQWLPWIHRDDIIGMILFAIDNEAVRGPLNAVAPEALRNRDFMRTIGKVWGTPSWMPVPGFALHAALGEVAEMLTSGQRAVPAKAQQHSYIYRYTSLESALRPLLARMK